MKLEDTINTCAERGETLAYLFEGKAHYPVPTIPYTVEFYGGYHGHYVALFQVLWTYDYGMHVRHILTWCADSIRVIHD